MNAIPDAMRNDDIAGNIAGVRGGEMNAPLSICIRLTAGSWPMGAVLAAKRGQHGASG